MHLYSKRIVFDVTYHLTLLFLMYKELWFYYYAEKKNDLNIYKFNHETKKSIIMRSRIYTPVRYKCSVCIVQKNLYEKLH